MDNIMIWRTYAWLFQQQSIFNEVIFWLGWGIIQLLKNFLDQMENLLKAVYQLGGFIFNEQVTKFMTALQPVLAAIFTLSLIFYFLCVFFNTIEDKTKIIKNVLLCIVVFCALTQVMTWMSDATFKAAENVSMADSVVTTETSGGDGKITLENMSTSDSILYSNTYDLYYMYTNGQFKDEAAFRNADSHIAYTKALTEAGINPTEKMWIKDDPYDKIDLFTHYLKYDKDGNPQETKIDNNMFAFLIDCYYRYYVDFWPVCIEFTFMALALLFASYKTARIIFELAVTRSIAIFVSAADLHDGRKIRELLKNILCSFITVFMIAVMLRFFLFATQYVQTLDISGWIKALIIAFLALATIDGPNLLERILGIDVGLSSGSRSIMSAVYGTQTAVRTATGVGRAATHAAKGVVHAGRAAGHAVAGFTPTGRAVRAAAKNEQKAAKAQAREAYNERRAAAKAAKANAGGTNGGGGTAAGAGKSGTTNGVKTGAGKGAAGGFDPVKADTGSATKTGTASEKTAGKEQTGSASGGTTPVRSAAGYDPASSDGSQPATAGQRDSVAGYDSAAAEKPRTVAGTTAEPYSETSNRTQPRPTPAGQTASNTKRTTGGKSGAQAAPRNNRKTSAKSSYAFTPQVNDAVRGNRPTTPRSSRPTGNGKPDVGSKGKKKG